MVPDADQMPAPGEDEQEEMRLFYVGAMRATQQLLITAIEYASFGGSQGDK